MLSERVVAHADTREQLWKTSLTIGRVVEASDIPTVVSRPGGACTDITPYYGITSTPVIDPETNTVYAMSNSVEGAGAFSAQYRCATCPCCLECPHNVPALIYPMSHSVCACPASTSVHCAIF